MSFQAAGGPLTPGGVDGTRDSIPWLRGGRWRTRSEPREAQNAHKSEQPSRAASGIPTRGSRRSGNDSAPPRPAGDTVIGYLPHGPAHRAQPSRPYLSALVRAPEGSAGAGGLSCCYLTLVSCARISRLAAHFNFRFSWVSRGVRLWTRGRWATGAVRTEGRTPGSPRVLRGENGIGCARALCPRAPAPGTREREFPPSAQSSLPGHGSPPLHV